MRTLEAVRINAIDVGAAEAASGTRGASVSQGTRGGPMVDEADEIRRLQGCVNDLVSLMALPAMWAGCDSEQVLTTLVDVLTGMFQLDLTYGRLRPRDSDHGSFETVRSVAGTAIPQRPEDVGRALAPWLEGDSPSSGWQVPNPVGSGEIAISRFWLGLGEPAGAVVVGSRRADFPTSVEALLLRIAVNQAILALQAADARAAERHAEEIERAKERLQAENLYLRQERDSERHSDEIVGASAAIQRVLRLVEQVAPTNACVLIQGETGTGKEMVARTLHRASHRSQRTFVKLNCAAIPSGLLESELFGHEKGAYTGAVARKLGRFELADGGTIFLDEVGEIPLELQAKLLRVLQESEFERLGGTRTIRVDVRLVAASNRDLASMVEERTFRSDLYYRLKVFPIVVPPLRDRPEDIPPLARAFAQRAAFRNRKNITTITAETMRALARHSWPGNVRELENLIERSVILSRGAELEVPLAELEPAPGNLGDGDGKGDRSRAEGVAGKLEDVERQHIRKVLDSSKWVIAGASGAAAKLGMKRTSLQYKMQKLGISRPR
jgi:formate hydrogenlyase transcriptional activator